MHHPPRPRRLFRGSSSFPAPGADARPSGGPRRLVAAVAALVSAAGLALAAPAASASAAPTSVAAAVAQHTATAKPARLAAHSTGKTSHQARPSAHPSDVRQVCSAPKRGYAQCMSLLRTNVKAHKGLFTHDTAPPGYGPPDLQSAYNLPSATAGSGETVAIVDAGDDPTAEADLGTYRSQYGLPACTTANGCFEKVNQEGQQGSYPPVDGTWPVEESLDLDMVSATCPNCQILLVEANSATISDLDTAEDEAVTLGAKYVSNSWASCEYSGETADDQYFNHPGVVITAAGGDNGYDNYLQGCTSPNYPAASPYVTAVGGTSLTRDSSTARGWTETTWSPDPSATGSGCSLYESKPAWQTDSGCANRMTNDVSAVADPNTGVAIYDTTGEGGWLEVGGTSAATPIIASAYALAGSPEAGTYPSSYPYLNATGLNDITSGTNYDQSCTPAYFCTAGPGYDGPTGLGTPDGVSAFTPVSAGTITGTVTDAATGQPLAGATVTAASFSATTNGSGHYTLTVAPGSYDMTVRAFGYAQQSASGVQVTQGQATTQNFALTTAADVTVTGTITDGSGQGWPLFAKISISGDPNPAYSDPFTGAYSISVPGQSSYTMTVTPLYPGYDTSTATVTIGTASVRQDVAVTVDTATCQAPGYAVSGGTCSPVSGGLLAGTVTDTNTGQRVNGATVTDAAGQTATSQKTPAPGLRAGFYWLFASPPGATSLTAAETGYQAVTTAVTVAAGAVTRQNWSLKAGQLAITPASLSATETLGQSAAQKLTLTNTGSAPVQVSLGTQAGSFAPAGQAAVQAHAAGPAFQAVKGHFTPGPAGLKALPGRGASRTAGKTATGWHDIASYPIPVCCNAAAADPQNGEVYSVDGFTSRGRANTAKGYAYDPSTGQWSAIAPAPKALQSPVAAFLGGTLYLAGGALLQGNTLTPSAALYAYTPGSNTWAKAASLPATVFGAMAAVLGGKLYVVGGCNQVTDGDCDQVSDAVYQYAPASNTWTTLATYPVPVSYGACAGIDGQVVCTGGRNTTDNDLSATYLYDPVTNTWTQGADMPSVRGAGYWGMSYTGSDGDLQIAGGVTSGSSEITNEAQEYDPVTNTWSLPNTNYSDYQAAGACGFYQIGGADSTSAQGLAGYDQCDGQGDTPWLAVKDTQVTVPAGRSVSITVRLDAAKASQPGSYTATLWTAASTPYPVQTIPVTLTVNPPVGWQEITGTVTSRGGTAIPGATVTLGSASGSTDVAATQTDDDGAYQWWLPSGRVQVSAAKDTYQPQAKVITLKTGAPATVNFALKPDPGTSPYQAASSPAGARHGSHGQAAVAARTATSGGGGFASACPEAQPGQVSCLALIRTNTPRPDGGPAPDTVPAGYGPSALQAAYNLPSSTGGSEATVAIVGAYDDPAAVSDLATYRRQYKLPACTAASGCFTKVNQNGRQGHYPAANASWAYDDSLGLDMASAVCPNCHLLLVEANNNDITSIGKAEDEAVQLGARYIANPYGGAAEAPDEMKFSKYFDHPGVAITAAAGDGGYGVEFPADLPGVTSVGGTTLTQDAQTARGWSETAWGSSDPDSIGGGTGAGCSAYEPKPAWQRDTGCQHRTDNDVAAVADPSTPVAVYDSSDGGWVEAGGTSVSASIIAATYALAGTPIAGTYPVSYPYLHASGLNDITTGADGTCQVSYLCTAGPGYDGPTGLGTPDGVTAFAPVTYGTLSGTVSTTTGEPVAGAAVTADGLTATTTSTGSYTLTVPPGSYDLTATDYGYAAATASGVPVTTGQTTAQNLTLTAAAKVTITGTVTDGSGHGWPLYAKITVSGVPGIPARTYYTSPFTGEYSIRLPGQNSYSLTATPDYPGYAPATVAVDAGTASVREDITVPVAPLACQQAPGYAFSATGGLYEEFNGWTGGTPQDGWTSSGTKPRWQFNYQGPEDLPGGPGGYAIASANLSNSGSLDTSLISPVFNLTGVSSPEISFNMGAYAYADFHARVDLSLDGGKTWQTVWRQASVPNQEEEDTGVVIPVAQAAGQSDVEIRFRYAGGDGSYWAIGDVLIGDPGCSAVPGGLVAGVVSDANTGQPVNGATVTGQAQSDTTLATGDPALPGGFYWLFSAPGTRKLTVRDGRYVPAKGSADVSLNSVTRQDWALQAGQLTADATHLSATETLGHPGTVRLTVRNSGAAALHIAFGTQAGEFTPLTRYGSRPASASTRGTTAKASAGSGWASIASLPAGVIDDAVAYDSQTRQVYSIGGAASGSNYGGTNPADSSYVYDPSAHQWSPIAAIPQPVDSATAAFLDGTLYVAGGWVKPDGTITASAAVYAYTPGSGTWSQVASLPTAEAGAAAAVLDGQLYVIGGCTGGGYCAGCGISGSCNSELQTVYRYDPATDTWARLADYPVYGGVAYEACAGIDGEVVCAGGSATGQVTGDPVSSTFLYNPASNTWTQGASMPYPDFQMTYTGANGQLQLSGGVTAILSNPPYGTVTSQVVQYNPATNTWSDLPALPSPEWGGGGACGMYVVGGDATASAGTPTNTAQVLSGYDQCDGAGDTGWLPAPRGFTLQPGQSLTVKVSLDAAKVDQPGTYTADLYAATNTPYANLVIPVTLTVKPPKGWGLLSGTVTKAGGKALAGATVQIGTTCTAGDRCGQQSFTLITAADGTWQWWLPTSDNGLLVIAADDGYIQQVTRTRVRRGQATTLNQALPAYQPPMR